MKLNQLAGGQDLYVWKKRRILKDTEWWEF